MKEVGSNEVGKEGNNKGKTKKSQAKGRKQRSEW